jgi:L-alanine-DL-glutamate epimerase-like enolase superfamily enzyme
LFFLKEVLMKVTDITAWKLTGSYTREWDDCDRVVRPLDMYDDYFNTRPDRTGSTVGRKKQANLYFIEIETDEGVKGRFGPIVYRAQLLIIMDHLKALIVGQDPLDTETLWDRMSRADRHARSGFMMMAVSAVDNCLWDLKGNYYKKPVFRLLGGNRTSLRVYGSMLGNSTLPERAAELGERVKNMGYAAQKWFFPWGPRSGSEGVRDNAALAAALRERLGPGYPLMFDAWMGWDSPYTRNISRLLEPYNPAWLEEPLMPQMLDAYRELRKQISIPLALGEHLYTAWEAKPFLEEGIASVMQSDPDWCGGITEMRKIAALCRQWGTPLMPHGCGVAAAAHTVASLPESLCPWVEYLFTYQEQQCCLFRYPLKPEGGVLTLRDDVYGLGMEIDEAKVESRQQIQF